MLQHAGWIDLAAVTVNFIGLAGGDYWCCDCRVASFLLQSLLAAAFLLFLLLCNSCRIHCRCGRWYCEQRWRLSSPASSVRGVCGMGCGHCSLCRTDLLRLLCGECVARGVSTALSVALIFFDRMPSGADRHQHGGMITSAQTPCGPHQ